MLRASQLVFATFLLASVPLLHGQASKTHPFKKDLSIDPPHIVTDKSIKYDYDIVYVRMPRPEKGRGRWAEVGDPRIMEPGSNLMLLHPDGSEEVLVPALPHRSGEHTSELQSRGLIS